MKEIKEIIAAYDEAKGKKLSCVLATVVHVEGSSYRRAGARMLVDEHGVMTGAISGGCLEGDALRKALHALDQTKNRLVTYDTSDEDDAIIGAQLGCNGVIQVLFEPVDVNTENNPIELLRKAVTNQQSVVVTLFDLHKKSKEQIGTNLLFDEKKESIGSLTTSNLNDQIIEAGSTALKEKISLFREYHLEDEKLNVFIEYFPPAKTLVLVGAGNDAQVLSQQAELLGWNIIIVDGRPTHANSARFTSSCQIVVAKPEAFLEEITIDEQTAFVLMTHNYNYDLAVLKELLNEESLPYIGILGPKKKYNRMLDDLKAEGISLSSDQANKVHAPVGLEIGAETPAEIGLSILSEIQSVYTQTNGGFLKEKDGPIHQKKNSQFEIIRL